MDINNINYKKLYKKHYSKIYKHIYDLPSKNKKILIIGYEEELVQLILNIN